MFGVVLATLNMAPTPSTPRTAAMAALRMKPVPRETIVPTAMVRVDRPSPSAADPEDASLEEPVTSGRPAAPQRPPGDADACSQQQHACADAGHGKRDPAVLRAAHHHRLLRAEPVLAPVDQLGLYGELAGRRARDPQVDL